MREDWSFYVARRYLTTHSGRKGHLGNILAILGLVIGILTLITVLTVMNGFQQGFITSINEVYSYHLRVEQQGLGREEFLEEIRGVSNVKSVVPFTDRQAILTSPGGFSSGIQVRFIDEDAAREDEGFINQLTMTRGEFSFSGENPILLGAELARSVNALPGDMVNLAFMTVKAGRASLRNDTFTVRGLFRTGYYEYDRNMAFSSLGDPGEGDLENASVLGIKLNHHFRDHRTLEDIRRAASLGEDEIVSWRNYNSAFFNALKIEKIFMLLVVGLIFIVVAVNIYHSMKRSVRERVEELALLKAMGGTPRGIRRIFLLQGAVIGICGCVLGTAAGILISLNINEIMGFFIDLIQSVQLMISSMTGDNLTGGSPFYYSDFPVQIMMQDLIIINAAALFSVLAAALGSIRSYAAVNPAVVFQSE